MHDSHRPNRHNNVNGAINTVQCSRIVAHEIDVAPSFPLNPSPCLVKHAFGVVDADDPTYFRRA